LGEHKLPDSARVLGMRSEGRRAAMAYREGRNQLLTAFAITATASMEAWLAAEEVASKMAKQYAWLEGYQLRAAKEKKAYRNGKFFFEVWGPGFDAAEILRRAQAEKLNAKEQARLEALQSLGGNDVQEG
jgi:hypothetical protein